MAADATRPACDVSDHALLRYLERVKGVDINAARREVIAICATAASLGANTKAHDGHIYILDGCWVTTVLAKGMRASPTRRQPRGPFGAFQRMRVE